MRRRRNVFDRHRELRLNLRNVWGRLDSEGQPDLSDPYARARRHRSEETRSIFPWTKTFPPGSTGVSNSDFADHAGGAGDDLAGRARTPA